MASGLPCPNPACKHVFAVIDVRGAATLTCPRCGRVFHFRPGTSPLANSVTPAAASPPLANPSAQALPLASRPAIVEGELVKPGPVASNNLPVGGANGGPAAAGIVPPSIVERHRQRASGSWMSLVMGCMVAALAVGMVLGGYFTFRTPRVEKPAPVGNRFAPRAPGPSGSTGPAGPVSSAASSGASTPSGPAQGHKSTAPKTPQDTVEEQPAPTEFVRGERCELEAPVGVWTKFKATDEDEQGDLFLVGYNPSKKDEALNDAKKASVLVVVLDKTDADLRAAMKMVGDRLAMQLKAQNKDARLVPLSDRPPPEAEQVGERRGQIVELKLQNGAEPRTYLLLAVVKAADAVYAIRCECNWEHRQAWQGVFRDLLKSFKLTKKS